IASALRPHQGVLCADTGHIASHETGAIEATGHKVLILPHQGGKITPEQVRSFAEGHWADETREHIPQPGMVYISNTTESGTAYTKPELRALSACCRELGLPLYLDGARLGYALSAMEDDLSFPDVARYCDAFTIGGTKQGLLYGEALVITNPVLQKDFRYHIKQRGGMLGKGFLMGLQFDAILSDGLYLSLARHANAQALRIREGFSVQGVSFYSDSVSNQQFPILMEGQIASLAENFVFSRIARLDNQRWATRFCTSWATLPKDVDQLLESIMGLSTS
ncbi:MAG: beta-eliminating lyase-related protein, partial [Eubacteriales bacterium]|nr:beta-eliminating lyase-related protein [Eubacteriales bacterium]